MPHFCLKIPTTLPDVQCTQNLYANLYEKVLKILILLLHLEKISPLKYFNLYQHLSYSSGALGKTRFSELQEKNPQLGKNMGSVRQKSQLGNFSVSRNCTNGNPAGPYSVSAELRLHATKLKNH